MGSMSSRFAAADVADAQTLRDRCFPPCGYTVADQTVNNTTTLRPASGLEVYCEGNTQYALNGYIAYTTNTTADIAISVSTPFGDVNSTDQGAFSPVSVAASSSNPGNIDTAFQTGFNGTALHGGSGHATLIMTFRPTAWFTATSPGLLQILFAQAVADASNTTIKAGSWIQIKKIGDRL